MIHNVFNKIISLENLFSAWLEFRKGKRHKLDVQIFELNLEDNLFHLHWLLERGKYQHGNYVSFCVKDPKQRLIHKAPVIDRVFHHAVFRVLYPIFDGMFINDSYSCRIGKGTHMAVKQLEVYIKRVSRNHQRSCFVLKCDVKSFFHSINHQILLNLIKKKIADDKAMLLIQQIIYSFNCVEGKGIPLGNLTSQLFANIYMNEFDQYARKFLKIKHYIRYTDDFVFVHNSRKCLKRLVPEISTALQHKLHLNLHPQKIFIQKVNQGVDFLGYVVFSHFTLLRTKTKKRILKDV